MRRIARDWRGFNNFSGSALRDHLRVDLFRAFTQHFEKLPGRLPWNIGIKNFHFLRVLTDVFYFAGKDAIPIDVVI